MADHKSQTDSLSSPAMQLLTRLGPYHLSKPLGKGTFAMVRLGQHSQTGDHVAVKIIPKVAASSRDKPKEQKHRQEQQHRRVWNEVGVLQHLRHRNIAQLLDFFESPNYFVLVMELVPSKSLYSLMRKAAKLVPQNGEPQPRFLSPTAVTQNVEGTDEEKAMAAAVMSAQFLSKNLFSIFYQLVSAVAYCHDFGLAHRDIKPENVLVNLDTGEAKLIDFGLCRVFDDEQRWMQTQCGSLAFLAPEVVRGELYQGPPADVWSLGVLLFELVTGRLPFAADNLSNLMKTICRGVFKIPAHLDQNLKHLLRLVLHPVAYRRITLPKLKKHPWWLKHCAKLGLDPDGIPAEKDEEEDTEVEDGEGCSGESFLTADEAVTTSSSNGSPTSPARPTRPLVIAIPGSHTVPASLHTGVSSSPVTPLHPDAAKRLAQSLVTFEPPHRLVQSSNRTSGFPGGRLRAKFATVLKTLREQVRRRVIPDHKRTANYVG